MGLRMSCSLNPACSPLGSMGFSRGLCASNHAWDIGSKPARLSPSKRQAAPPLGRQTLGPCASASTVDRSELHP